MGLTSIWHWLILLIVVVAVFGTSKLRNAGKDIGQAVKGFKDAVKDETAQLDKKDNDDTVLVKAEEVNRQNDKV